MAVTTQISSQIALSGEARVESVQGSVRVINAQGQVRLLKAGDIVHAGERIVAEAEGSATLFTASGEPLVIEGGRLVALDEAILNPQTVPDSTAAALQAPSVQQQVAADTDAILRALEAGQDPFAAVAPAAAGLSGAGGEDGGSTFIRLARIAEGLTDVGLTASFDIANQEPGTLAVPLPAVELGNGVTIGNLIPAVEGGEGTVREAGLAGGSGPAGGTSFTGSFTVTAVDGLDSIVIGGVTIVTDNTQTANTTITTALGNTLTITGFDSATGVVSYTYTLTDAETHAAGDGNNTLFDSVSVFATDVDGSSSSDTLSVTIVDDVPTAQPDSASVSEDSTLVASGNVLANDTLGADTPATVTSVNGASGNVGVAIAGLYGKLTLNADGSYSYTLNNGSAAVQGLSAGEQLSDSFSYVMQDADGDRATSTLTLTIDGSNDGVTIGGLNPDGAEGTVFEAALSSGSDPSATTESLSGTFTVTAADGLDEIVLGGVTIVDSNALTANSTVTTGLGNTLTITGFNAATGVVSYTYTLTAAETHAAGDGNNTLLDSTSLVVRDVDGSTASNTLDIVVTDDVPVAVDDTGGSVSETSVSFSGTVLGNDTQGADRIGSGPVTAGTFAGTCGTLELHADGSYIYTLNTADPDFIGIPGGASRTDTFSYTLNDSDGDQDTATLTLTVSNADDGVTISGLSGQGTEQTVDEDDLVPDGSDQSGSTTVSGSFTVDAPDGVTNLTVGGIDVVSGGVVATFPQSAASPLGNALTITGFDGHTVSYSYTLLDNESHATGSGENSLTESFTVDLQDRDGDSTSASLDVVVTDDVPDAVDDLGGSVSETSVSFSGTVLGNDIQGADRIGSGPVTAGTFAGTYGTLTLNADGSYIYTLTTADPDFIGIPGGASRAETFSYTLNDSDGDSATATLTLTVSNADDGVTITGLSGQGAERTVDEDDLVPDGSDQSGSTTVSGSFTVDAPDGVTTLTVGGIAVVSGGVVATFPQSAASPLGNTLTITGFDGHTVSYSYTLLDNESHATGGGENSLTESFAVTLQDSDGDSTSASLDVAVTDDVPSAFTPDTAHMVDQTDSSHSVTDELNFAGHTGADGVGNVVFNITEGTAALDADGNQLRLDGVDLFLYYGGASGTDQTQLVAKTATGDIGFTVDIDPMSDSYTLATYGIISSGPAEVNVTSLSSIGGGNIAIKGLLDVGGTTQDVILSSTSGTVNTDQDDIGIGNGQTLSNTDNVRFDFVNGLAFTGNPNNPSTYSYSTHSLVFGFEQRVLINGNAGATANLTLTAIVADDDQTYGTADGGESQLDLSVSNITVYDVSHNVVASGTQGLTITDQGNSILITGLQDGWSYQITSTDTFSAVDVAGASGTHTFALGSFSYSQTIPGQPIDLSFDITATDGDGDPIASQIDATLYPSDLSLEGDGGVNTLTATLSHPFVFGYGGDDTLDGAVGGAVLVGGDGNDLLIYGIGDTIDGGSGFDTLRVDSSVDLSGKPISNIEQLQLTGASTTLQLRPEDVLNFTNAGDHTLFVRGESGDTLDLVGVTSPTTTGPDVTVDGVIYAHYQFDVDGTTVTVNVEKTVNVI